MTGSNGGEKRGKKRRKLIRTGTIEYDDQTEPMSCVLLDISQSGGSLRPDDPQALPERFDLRIKHGPAIACKVVRRTDENVAVVFVKRTP